MHTIPQNVPGNFYDKYNTRNPVARYLMNGFLEAFDSLVDRTSAKRVYEAGCGEGHLSCRLLARGLDVRGSDLEPSAVRKANENAKGLGFGTPFSVCSVYDLDRKSASADLVICCEVLEHLPDPEAALEVLSNLAEPFLLVSVPREPVWRLLNMARGAYWQSLGNTPGHIQHWSSRRFLRMLGRRFEIIEVRQPFPWTMVLCKTERLPQR